MRNPNPNLPEELLIEIFSRLPSKSVGRCRCLSKLWRSRLSNSQFLDLHFTRKPHLQNLILITVDNLIERRGHSTHTTTLPVAEFTVLKKLDVPNNWVRVVGSCNGLVLMKDKHADIYLVNPVTKERVSIPTYLFNPNNVFRGVTIYGFGYDSSSKDYKIVMLGGCPKRSVAVYSFKTGLWVRKDNFPFEYHIYQSGVFFNGALHWFVANEDSGHSPMIVAFDLSSEVFRVINVPTYANGRELGSFCCAHVLKGCLCIVNTINMELDSFMDAWMLKEYGLQDSWTNFTFYAGSRGQVASLIKPICYIGENKLVFLDQDKRSLFVSNVKEKTNKVVCNRYFITDGCEFVESLVSPKRLAGVAERE